MPFGNWFVVLSLFLSASFLMNEPLRKKYPLLTGLASVTVFITGFIFIGWMFLPID
jgi:hypothetical protein